MQGNRKLTSLVSNTTTEVHNIGNRQRSRLFSIESKKKNKVFNKSSKEWKAHSFWDPVKHKVESFSHKNEHKGQTPQTIGNNKQN